MSHIKFKFEFMYYYSITNGKFDVFVVMEKPILMVDTYDRYTREEQKEREEHMVMCVRPTQKMF